jgi:hemerythrin superfamily protein
VKQQFDKMGIYLPIYKKKEKDKKQYRELLEIIKQVNLEPKPNTEKQVAITSDSDLGMKNIVDNDLDDFINAL